jgi:hypothetical protein
MVRLPQMFYLATRRRRYSSLLNHAFYGHRLAACGSKLPTPDEWTFGFNLARGVLISMGSQQLSRRIKTSRSTALA